ncbi:hypothetical protein DIURU_005623 [Diutina rugosa]|uniref:ribonuclease III n=1 Tax=Diutina rugosa TaxID=5481 RepID=A0A642UC75_DIURU|nr:uncharacterized protein DIURU_005623 [Diutina rugosa]KAA8896611.1 hypothetical protein DIURU_005623 [Diutina rugosa]
MDADDFVSSLSAIASSDDPQATAAKLPGHHKTRKRPSAATEVGSRKTRPNAITNGATGELNDNVNSRQVEYHMRTIQKSLEFLLAQTSLPDAGDDLVKLGHRFVHAAKTNDTVAKLVDNLVKSNTNKEDWQDIIGDDEIMTNALNDTKEVSSRSGEVAKPRVVKGAPSLPPIPDTKLYQQVFTHKSSVSDKFYLSAVELLKLHNERLEFLGDSIINNIVTVMLYERFPDLSEGQLSQRRSELICNKTLTEFSKLYGFPDLLKSNLDRAVIESGAQKAYADIFEAYVGALTVTHYPNMDPVRQWVHQLYEPKLQEMERGLEHAEINKDAKSVLYSLVGSASAHPEYKVIAKGNGTSEPFVVECRLGGEVVGVGEANNQKNAGLRAAMEALKRTDVIEKYYKLRLEQEPSVTQISTKKQVTASGNFDAVDWSLFPVPNGDDSLKLRNQTKNELYGLCGRQFNETPIYRMTEHSKSDYEAHLYVGDHMLSKGRADSRKKAMTRAAMALTANRPAMVALFGEDYESK